MCRTTAIILTLAWAALSWSEPSHTSTHGNCQPTLALAPEFVALVSGGKLKEAIESARKQLMAQHLSPSERCRYRCQLGILRLLDLDAQKAALNFERARWQQPRTVTVIRGKQETQTTVETEGAAAPLLSSEERVTVCCGLARAYAEREQWAAALEQLEAWRATAVALPPQERRCRESEAEVLAMVWRAARRRPYEAAINALGRIAAGETPLPLTVEGDGTTLARWRRRAAAEAELVIGEIMSRGVEQERARTFFGRAAKRPGIVGLIAHQRLLSMEKGKTKPPANTLPPQDSPVRPGG